MKTSPILLLTLIGSVMWTSLQAQLVLFTPSDTMICAADPATFTNHYPNLVGYTYNWDFGDSTYSQVSGNAIHSYSQLGTAIPSLTITGDSFLYFLKSVKILAIPNDFIGGFDFRPDLYIRVKDASGSTIISTPKGTHNHSLPKTFGGYNKVLGLQNYVIHVYEYDRATSDEHSSVSFSMPIGNGTATSSDGLTVSWVIDSIPLTPYAKTIQVLPPLAKPQLIASSTTTFCGSPTVPLQSTVPQGLQIFWRRNGVDIPGATDSTYLPTQTGYYQSVATNGSCKRASDSVLITINPLPAPQITASGPLTLCDSGTVALAVDSVAGFVYQWYQGNQLIPGASQHKYTAQNSGDYHIAVTDTNGCMGTSTATAFRIYASSLQATISSATGRAAVCQGDTLQLEATRGLGLTYQWFYAGTTVSNAIQPHFPATDSGAYQVIVTDPAGCGLDTSDVFRVSLLPAPPTPLVSALDPTDLCEGEAVLLIGQAATGMKYQWAKDQANLVGEKDSTYLASTAGAYSLTITDTAGCMATSLPLIVTEIPSPMTPTIIRQNDTLIATPVDLNLTYQWFLDGTLIPNQTSPYHLPSTTGAFTVTAISPEGCESDISTAFSTVSISDKRVKKAFTLYPNPTQGTSWIQVSSTTHGVLEAKVYDLQGRLMTQQSLESMTGNTYRLKLDALRQGHYIIVLSQENQHLGSTKVWKKD